MGDVAIVGLGITQMRRSTPEVSYELIFEAAVRAYEDPIPLALVRFPNAHGGIVHKTNASV